MRSEIEARILEAAIELFAERGYAASARDIAEKADTTTMTMYRAFRNRKEYLFEEALREVITRSFDPGKFVLLIYEGDKSADFSEILASALQTWYNSIPDAAARLLGYACLSSEDRWRDLASSAIDRIIDILTTAIERQIPKAQKQKFDSHIAAKAIIKLLFEMRMTRPITRSAKADKEEAKEIEATIRHWLHGLAEAAS